MKFEVTIKTLHLLVVIITCLLSFPTWGDEATSYESSKLCLNISGIQTEAKGQEFYYKRLREIYEHAGLCVNIVNLPYVRTEKMLERGTIDGAYARGGKFFLDKPYLTKLPTPISYVGGVAIIRKSFAVIPRTAKDLKKHRVALLHGADWAVKLSAEVDVKYTTVKDVGNGIRLLRKGHIDYLLINTAFWSQYIKNEDTNDVFASPHLISIKAYHVLHKSHQRLVRQLDESLRVLYPNGVN